jgi:hypothetical protein
MAFVAPAIGAIGSLIGGLFGMGAAARQKKADQQAAGTVQAAGQQVQNFTQKQLAASQAELNPYVTAGQNAFSNVGSLMQQGAGGVGPLAAYTGTFQAPTAAQAEATPGYQFQLQQGQQALENSAAARGGLLSAGTGKQLEQYGQGLASTNYQQVYNNAMQQYQQQYAQFQNNQANLYNRLMGIGQTGLGATQTSVGANLQGAGLYGQQGQLAASQQAGYQAQAGGAQAIGLAGLGNSIGNAMGSFAGAWPQSQPVPPPISAPSYNVPGSSGFQPFNMNTVPIQE